MFRLEENKLSLAFVVGIIKFHQLLFWDFFTIRSSNCRKVMFSQPSFSKSVHRRGRVGMPTPRSILGSIPAPRCLPGVCLVPGPFYGLGTPPGRYTHRRYTPWKVHPLELTSIFGHQSERYESYWNAYFLLLVST